MTNEQRGIAGVCRVCIYDGSMGYGSTSIILDWVSKAVARSVAKHYNKQVPEDLDICYYVEYRDELEPDLSYWS